MSRKGIFSDIVPGGAKGAAVTSAPSVTRLGAALEKVGQRADRAKEIEQQLAQGLSVIEIDPLLIDPSPVPDRLRGGAEADAELRADLAATGQQLPVLLRPHPSSLGRFVTVYGHRRVAALKSLGHPVKAIVRAMSEAEAFLAQGIENSARRDLSFIERAVFAAGLEQSGIAQIQITKALHTAGSNVSFMIALVRRLPRDLIAAIGSSPGIGRRRWEALADDLAKVAEGNEQGPEAVWRDIVAEKNFDSLDGDARFERIHAAVDAKLRSALARPVGSTPVQVLDADGAAFAEIERSKRSGVKLRLPPNRIAPRSDGAIFNDWVADWLAERLPHVLDAWRRGE